MKRYIKESSESSVESDLLNRLENAKDSDEFWAIMDEIDDLGYVFFRKRGYNPEIFSVSICDKYGRRCSGVIDDTTYLTYLVNDGHSRGRCKFRHLTNYVGLEPREGRWFG